MSEFGSNDQDRDDLPHPEEARGARVLMWFTAVVYLGIFIGWSVMLVWMFRCRPHS